VDGHRQPWRIVPQDDEGLIAFAGLWEMGEGGGHAVQSCTIFVGEANERVCAIHDRMCAIHDRMPVILEPYRFDDWLDGRATAPALKELLRPLPDSRLRLYRFSEHVNNSRNDDAACIHPLP
jgi:putative SOS response-associated peptidase YedK